MTILVASTKVTSPSFSAMINDLESRAIRPSQPVPTIGASGLNNGTA